MRTIFYFRKKGKPVNIDVEMQYTTSHFSPLLTPVLDGAMAEDNVLLNETAASLGIEYQCNTRGGVSAIWMAISVRATDGACQSNGYHRSGVHQHAPKTFQLVVIWEKFCSDMAATVSGINVGLTRSSAEVVANGQTLPSFRVDASIAAVRAHEESSRFFIYTTDGSSKVFGPPTLIVDQTQLLVTFHGDAEKGGVATSSAKELEVRYMCAMEHVTSLITIEMDVCDLNVQPADCNFETSNGRHPLNFQYTKLCRKDKVLRKRMLWLAILGIVALIGYNCYLSQNELKAVVNKYRSKKNDDDKDDDPDEDGVYVVEEEMKEIVLPADDSDEAPNTRVSLLAGSQSNYGSI